VRRVHNREPRCNRPSVFISSDSRRQSADRLVGTGGLPSADEETIGHTASRGVAGTGVVPLDTMKRQPISTVR
jgi:hypothetical protein